MQFGTFTEVGSLPLDRAEELPFPSWKSVARQPEEVLGTADIAWLQFVAHQGLPGAEQLNPWGCIRKINAIADRVRARTRQEMRRFHRDPGDFENSEPYFRALVMATVFCKEFGVRYDPAKIPRDVPFGPADTTVHGILFGQGGTCASLPVLYAAVGRRLGYPIKLVSCYVTPEVSHLFARWDGADDRFNIETTGAGLGVQFDEDYRTGKYALMTPECERLGRHMLSQTPRMEFAGFLRSRAGHWRDAGKVGWRTEVYAWAFALDPLNIFSRDLLVLSFQEWTRRLRERQPPGFPTIVLEKPTGYRFFPESLPETYEQEYLACLAVENLLDDAEYGKAWERMRRGTWKGRGPNHATVRYDQSGASEMTVTFNA